MVEELRKARSFIEIASHSLSVFHSLSCLWNVTLLNNSTFNNHPNYQQSCNNRVALKKALFNAYKTLVINMYFILKPPEGSTTTNNGTCIFHPHWLLFFILIDYCFGFSASSNPNSLQVSLKTHPLNSVYPILRQLQNLCLIFLSKIALQSNQASNEWIDSVSNSANWNSNSKKLIPWFGKMVNNTVYCIAAANFDDWLLWKWNVKRLWENGNMEMNRKEV